jgi:protein-tyrosine phosphatase
MLLTELHWVDGPWPGRLALAARPRGGEWLGDEMAQWRMAGVDTVVSLLEADEERELSLSSEGCEARARGMTFKSLPIADRQVPLSKSDFARVIEELDGELVAGRNVVVHCRQGIGRTGLVGACLFVLQGFEPENAVSRLSEARGLPVPETPEQMSWVDRYAEMFSYKR